MVWFDTSGAGRLILGMLVFLSGPSKRTGNGG